MRKIHLIRISVVAVLAFGAIPASGALAKPALVLKEEHVPVPVGTEVTVDLETSWTKCDKYNNQGQPYVVPMVFHGQMAVNGARTDVMTFSPEESECAGVPLYASEVRGGLKEMSLAVAGHHGKATIHASLVMAQSRHAHFSACVYDFNTLVGQFPIPGYARIEGVARGALDVARTYEGEEKCPKTHLVAFKAAVYGHNGTLLETAPG